MARRCPRRPAMRQAPAGPDPRRGITASSLWLRTAAVRSYTHLRVIPAAEPGGITYPGGKCWCGAGAVGTVGLWPSIPTCSHRFAVTLRRPGNSVTSTGRCRPSSQTLSWPSRCRGSSRSSKKLARRYRVVAVVSGRPVDFLAARLPAPVLLAGLYGLEVQHLVELQTDPEAERWRTVVSAAATRIHAAAPPGVLVEPKGLSVTCHYRANPALEPQVTALAREVEATAGLVARPAASPWSCFPRFVPTRARSSGTGLPAFVLPAISEMTSATWLRSLRSTSWPPGGSPQPGSRCAAMRRLPNYCKPRI